MTPARLLIVGGGGFLGRHVRRALEDGGVPAGGIERVSVISGSADDGVPTTDRGWHRLDLATADRAAISEVLRIERPTAVINTSGVTHGAALGLVHGNVVQLGELLAAIATATPGLRFVQVGSSAEYGAVPRGNAIHEATAPAPVAPYGVAKLAATELTLAAGRAGVIDGLVLRVFNPIGGGMPTRSLPGQAAVALRQALATGERRIVLGSLDDHRDFVDVRDVAEAIVAAAIAGDRLGPRILNVGSGRATQARDLVTRMAVLAGYDGDIEETAPGSPRSSAVPWQQADIGAIDAVLGWRPRRELDVSIEAVLADDHPSPVVKR